MRATTSRPGQDDDFSVENLADVLQIKETSTRAFATLVAAIASVSLLVGGIGIMNIMLVSVLERVREIGIRMAVGARQADIMTQFLIEAAALSLTGGALGIVVGVARRRSEPPGGRAGRRSSACRRSWPPS